jgi:hypothetical protein
MNITVLHKEDPAKQLLKVSNIKSRKLSVNSHSTNKTVNEQQAPLTAVDSSKRFEQPQKPLRLD